MRVRRRAHDCASVRAKNPKRWQRLAGGTLLAIIAAAILVAQTASGQAALRATGVASPRQSFSELYFLHPSDVSRAMPTSRRLQIQFVVHRDGQFSVTYGWEIHQLLRDRSPTLAGGTLVVPAGESVLVSTTVRLSCARRRTQVRVALVGTSLLIDRWLVCPPHR